MTPSSGQHHTLYVSAMGTVSVVLLMARDGFYADTVYKKDNKRDQGGRALSSTSLKSDILSSGEDWLKV